eukprot:m.825347 g.825347  ORF g.825347 m.825347 type:complete len:102 (+) comp59409_c0_seq6:181-486(+)
MHTAQNSQQPRSQSLHVYFCRLINLFRLMVKSPSPSLSFEFPFSLPTMRMNSCPVSDSASLISDYLVEALHSTTRRAIAVVQTEGRLTGTCRSVSLLGHHS